MTVADRMAVFMEGRIVQIGTPKEVYLRPATAMVAAFIGTPPMNLMPAQLRGAQAELLGATLPVAVAASTAAAREVTLGVRPGDLRIAASGIAAQVELVEDLGDSVIINLRAGEQRLKMRHDGSAPPNEGAQVFLGFAPAAAHLFDRESGARI